MHKIWWTCLLPSRSCCNNQHFMHIMTRNTLFIWHPPNSIYGFFWWSLRCCCFFRMKFAHTEITIIAAITLQWRRWQQQQSCLIGIGRILGFFILAFFWLLGCSIYNFTEILCGLVINSFSDGSSWKSSEIYIISCARPGLPDELKVEQQFLAASGCVCLCVCVRVSHIFVTILFLAFHCAAFALRLCGPN